MTTMRQAEAELEKSGKALDAARRALDRAQKAHDGMEAALSQAKEEQSAHAVRDGVAAELMADPGIRDAVADMDWDEAKLVCRAMIADGSLLRLVTDARKAVRPELERLEERRERRRYADQRRRMWDRVMKGARAELEAFCGSGKE